MPCSALDLIIYVVSNMFLWRVCDITSEQSSEFSPGKPPWTSQAGIWTMRCLQWPLFQPSGQTVNIKELVSHWRLHRKWTHHVAEGVTQGRPTGECGCGGICRSGWSCCWGWSWRFRNSPEWETLPRAGMTQKNDGWSGCLPILCQHFKKKNTLYIAEYCEYLSEMVISVFIQEAEVVDY